MRLKKVTQNDPVERLAVSVKRSTMNMLDSYRQHYFRTYGEEIEKSHLVEEMLRDFMTNDKHFAKALDRMKEKPKPGATKPLSGNVESRAEAHVPVRALSSGLLPNGDELGLDDFDLNGDTALAAHSTLS